jgi:hypothetical protein
MRAAHYRRGLTGVSGLARGSVVGRCGVPEPWPVDCPPPEPASEPEELPVAGAACLGAELPEPLGVPVFVAGLAPVPLVAELGLFGWVVGCSVPLLLPSPCAKAGEANVAMARVIAPARKVAPTICRALRNQSWSCLHERRYTRPLEFWRGDVGAGRGVTAAFMVQNFSAG